MLDLSQTRSNRSRGFTLLEILMVLVLLGLVSSLIVPRVGLIYDNLVLRGERDQLLRDIHLLSIDANTRRSDIVAGVVQATGAQVMSVPDGWNVAFSDGLVFKSNGFCTGGVITLSHQSDRVWNYSLAAPFCEPELKEDET